MSQTCKKAELITEQSNNALTLSDTDDMPVNEIRKAQSFADIIEPPIEKLVHVQKSVTCINRSNDLLEKDTFFSVKSKTNIDHKTVLKDKIATKSESNSPVINSRKSEKDTHMRPQNLCASKNVPRTKKAQRRYKLPQSTNNNNIDDKNNSTKLSITSQPSFQRPNFLRIPSVEMNHNEFEGYFENDSSISDASEWPPYNDDKVKFTNHQNSAHHVIQNTAHHVTQNSAHHVISCPNFRSLQTNVTDLNITATKVESIYPKLDEIQVDSNVLVPAATVPPTAEKLYPSLLGDVPFDSVTFHANSDKVSFNRQNSTIQNLPSPNLPPRTSPSRMNSVQSNTTVTITDELFLNDQLQELPLADIKFSDAKRTSKIEQPSAPTGFASLIAE